MRIGTNVTLATPPFPKIRGELHNVRFPCYVEPKIDGEANIYTNGYLVSKASGKARTDFPVTKLLGKIVDNSTIVFGELHWDIGKAGALYDFLSHATDDDLNFTIFDVYHPTLNKATYEARREWIIEHILNNPEFKEQPKYKVPGVNFDIGKLRITRPTFIENKEALDIYITTNRDEGWEGVVVKNKDSVLFADSLIEVQGGWVKVKHKYTGDYEVLGIDPTLERMDVAVPFNGANRIVGVKLVHKYKPLVNVGDIVEIEHQGQLAQGGLRHPTFRGKVVANGISNVSK